VVLTGGCGSDSPRADPDEIQSSDGTTPPTDAERARDDGNKAVPARGPATDAGGGKTPRVAEDATPVAVGGVPTEPRIILLDKGDGSPSRPEVIPGRWVRLAHSLRVPHTLCAGVKSTMKWEFGKDGVRAYVTRDDAPRQLAGIVVESEEAIGVVREAFTQGDAPLVISCSAHLVEALPPLPPNRYIALSLRSNMANLAPLAKLGRLSALQGWVTKDVADLSPLATCRILTALELNDCYGVSDLSPLRHLLHLEHLSISDARQATDISALGGLRKLKTLELILMERLTDLSPLADHRELSRLHLTGCDSIGDIAPLKSMENLTHLSLQYCERVSTLAPLAGLTRLKELNIDGCAVTDLSPLSDMHELDVLSLWTCKGVEDLSPLSSLRRLRRLVILECPGITSVLPLRGMAQRGGHIVTDVQELRKQFASMTEQ
jgi:hypothetical protein